MSVKELKLQIAQECLKTMCPEKTMEELYFVNNLTTANHINVVTQHEYSGLNRFALELAMLINGFNSCEWATFPQFKSQDIHIKKGSKATKISVAIYKKKTDEQTKEEKETLNFFKGGSVFNKDQTESLQTK